MTFGPNVQCINYNTVDLLEPTNGTIIGWGARDVRILMFNIALQTSN